MTNILPVPDWIKGKVQWQGWNWDKVFRVPAGAGGHGLVGAYGRTAFHTPSHRPSQQCCGCPQGRVGRGRRLRPLVFPEAESRVDFDESVDLS